MREVLKRCLCIMTAFILSLGVFTTANASTKKVTAKWVNDSIRSYPKVKVGNNTVFITGSTNRDSRAVDFVAPQDGTYTFKFNKTRSSEINLPAIHFYFETGMKGSNQSGFKIINFNVGNKSYDRITLMTPKWKKSINKAYGSGQAAQNTINDAAMQGYLDNITTKIKLRKNEVLRINNYFAWNMSRDAADFSETDGSLMYNLKISKN